MMRAIGRACPNGESTGQHSNLGATMTKIAIEMKLEEIRDNGTYDDQDICRDPGRLEGEHIATAYYDAEEFADSEFGEQDTIGFYRVFKASQEERDVFKCEENETHFVIEYNSQGFLTGYWLSAKKAEKLEENVDSLLDDEDPDSAF